jgi:hypothetical protein
MQHYYLCPIPYTHQTIYYKQMIAIMATFKTIPFWLKEIAVGSNTKLKVLKRELRAWHL